MENESHCDFVKLREMLIRTNMEDMREKTHNRHYELYRKRRLQQMGFSDVDAENKPVRIYNFLKGFTLPITLFNKIYASLSFR